MQFFFYQMQFLYALPQFLAENAVTPKKQEVVCFKGSLALRPVAS